MTETARIPTSEGPSKVGWTLETAIDYLLAVIKEKDEHVRTLIAGNDKRYEERFGASQKALELGLAGQKSEISAALAAADRAVSKAELATEKRFESVNEFRATLDNQQRTLIPRSEVDVMIRGVEEKIAQVIKQQDALIAERQGLKGGWGYAVGVIGFVLTLVTLGLLIFKAVKP